MKKLFVVIMLLVSVNLLTAKQLNVAIYYNQYLNTNGQTYIETYFSLDPRSVMLTKDENNMYRGGIEILITIEQGNEIIAYDKLKLDATASLDTTSRIPYTIQQSRVKLDTGTYLMKIELADIKSMEPPILLSQEIEVSLNRGELQTSNILLLDSYQESSAESVVGKWGYDLVPIVPSGTYYISDDVTLLPFYCEVFNSDTIVGMNQPFMVKYYLKDNLTNDVVPRFAGFKRANGAVVNPILNTFDITNLPTGYYELVLEVINQKNETLNTNSVSFYRRNYNADKQLYDTKTVLLANSFVEHFTNVDSLHYYIDCLNPISNDSERRISENVLASRDVDQMQRYLLVFWNQRNPIDPQLEREKYMVAVRYAQKQFGTFTVPGYRADMGRVLLQYGPPTIIESEPQTPSTYPYQIWQYDVLASESTPTQNNQIFVFADLTGIGRNYTLIHSGAIGEVQDYKWEYVLNKLTNRGGDVDAASQQQQRDNFGGRLNNNFIIGDQRYWGER